MKLKCKDHLGKEFNSLREMSLFWHIPYSTFLARFHRGYCIKDCLTAPVQPCKRFEYSCKDHLGNLFPSLKKLCNFHKVNYGTFLQYVHKYGYDSAIFYLVRKAK